MKKFILILSFMTRIPVPNIDYSEENMGKSMKLFSLVGLIIGILMIILSKILLRLNLNHIIISVLVVLFEVLITGAIHLDGLADTFDGIFSYRPKERILEIMKDSHVGTNGVIALIFSIIIKTALIYEIIYYNLEDFILLMPIISRISSIFSCAFFNYARENGMTKSFIEHTKPIHLLPSFLLAFIFIIFYYYYYHLNVSISFASVILFSYIFSKYVTKKIGGITGDILGAIVEISEILYLFITIFIYIN